PRPSLAAASGSARGPRSPAPSAWRRARAPHRRCRRRPPAPAARPGRRGARGGGSCPAAYPSPTPTTLWRMDVAPSPVPAPAAWPRALAAELGLTDDEYAKIVATLGRAPSTAELGTYSVMWSEHCSYKSSKVYLRELPTSGERILVGPGEN